MTELPPRRECASLSSSPGGSAAAIPDQSKPVHTAQFKKNYVLIMQNERGSEWSGGDFGILTTTTADAQDTLDWISAQEWSNGKVGAPIGGSVRVLLDRLTYL
jgi:predicted acyl esterase